MLTYFSENPNNMLANLLLLTLNKILSANEGSLCLLKCYAGKSFSLNLVGISISALISEDGSLLPIEPDIAYNVSIIIPPTAATYLVTQDKLAVFKQISFTGEIEFGRALLEILSNLHLDGIYANVSPITGVLIAQLDNIFNIIREQLRLIGHNFASSSSEYLLYESADIVTRHEIADFCTDVDEINDRTNIITQRINLLLAAKP